VWCVVGLVPHAAATSALSTTSACLKSECSIAELQTSSPLVSPDDEQREDRHRRPQCGVLIDRRVPSCLIALRFGTLLHHVPFELTRRAARGGNRGEVRCH